METLNFRSRPHFSMVPPFPKLQMSHSPQCIIVRCFLITTLASLFQGAKCPSRGAWSDFGTISTFLRSRNGTKINPARIQTLKHPGRGAAVSRGGARWLCLSHFLTFLKRFLAATGLNSEYKDRIYSLTASYVIGLCFPQMLPEFSSLLLTRFDYTLASPQDKCISFSQIWLTLRISQVYIYIYICIYTYKYI